MRWGHARSFHVGEISRCGRTSPRGHGLEALKVSWRMKVVDVDLFTTLLKLDDFDVGAAVVFT